MPSPEQHEYAALLLRKAREDLDVVEALIDNASIADDVIGFHAQQAVEKAMKAVLVNSGIDFRRSHDLTYLLHVADAGGVLVPEAVAAARWLTPWAAEFRYDEPPAPALDRTEALRSASDAVVWGESAVLAP